MIIYFAYEKSEYENHRQTAVQKAREDLYTIFNELGFLELSVFCNYTQKTTSLFSKIFNHVRLFREWKSKTSQLSSGDVLILQFPLIFHTFLFGKIMKACKKRNVAIILLLHDLDTLRIALSEESDSFRRLRITLEEETAIKKSDAIISHNQAMSDVLISKNGYDENKIVPLEIFDYLLPDFDRRRIHSHALSKPVAIAGNLRSHKAGYAYNLPATVMFNLYGVNYSGKNNSHISYKGSFDPDDLPYILDGSFGLVWDGPSAATCQGEYGSYLRINNPHKASLYLASCLPVITWKQSALSDFIENNGCGISIDSIDDIPAKLKSISEEDYEKMLSNARVVSNKVRTGYYTKRALQTALSRLNGSSQFNDSSMDK